VRDNGGGIDPDRMPRLFQPFQSSKGSRGTGLGLAISQKIAREHGGDLLVSNRPGHGCEFTLRIPLRNAA
jgi:signal transduction histidine kinase